MCRHIHHSKWCGRASRCTIPPQQSGYKTGFRSRLIIHNPVSREQTFLLKQFKGAGLLLKPMDGGRIERAERAQLRKKREGKAVKTKLCAKEELTAISHSLLSLLKCRHSKHAAFIPQAPSPPSLCVYMLVEIKCSHKDRNI